MFFVTRAFALYNASPRTLLMPQGTWPITLYLQDAVGNRGSPTSSDLQQQDQPWQFTQAGPGDDTAPMAVPTDLARRALPAAFL